MGGLCSWPGEETGRRKDSHQGLSVLCRAGNVVYKGKEFILYCPGFSQWPYELWVSPVVSDTRNTFGDISGDQLQELSEVIPKTTRVIIDKFSKHEALHKHPDENDVLFNFYIYPGRSWFVRIIPRLIHPGGFELASGIAVNIVEPEIAVVEYRKML